MRGAGATGGQHAGRGSDARQVVRGERVPYEDHGPFDRVRFRPLARKRHPAGGDTGRRRLTKRQEASSWESTRRTYDGLGVQSRRAGVSPAAGVRRPSATISTAIRQRSQWSSLADSALQDVQLAFLDRELDVLHVLGILFEPPADPLELAKHLRHRLLELQHGAGGLPGDDILSLHAELEIHHHLVGARRGVSGESHPRSRVHASVAEHHRLHVTAVEGADSSISALRNASTRGPRAEPSTAEVASLNCSLTSAGNLRPVQIGEEPFVLRRQPPKASGIELYGVGHSLAVQAHL